MTGEVYRLQARGKAHEQSGRRFAVVLQPDWLNLSTWIVAFTSTRARETSYRPPVTIGDQETLVMRDQLATVDLNRFTEPVGSSPSRNSSESTTRSPWSSTCSRASGSRRPVTIGLVLRAETHRRRRCQSAAASWASPPRDQPPGERREHDGQHGIRRGCRRGGACRREDG